MSALARRARLTVVGLLGLILAAACGSGSTAGRSTSSSSGSASPGAGAPSTAPGTSRAGGPNGVTIHLVAFDPPTLEVARGTAVTWIQTDKGSVHTVTSGTVDTDPTGATTTHADGRFDSGQLAEGKQFTFTFTQPGTYPYFCVIHQATMRGEVRVR